MTELGLLRIIKSEELELMLSWRNADSVRCNMYNSHIISIKEHLTWWNMICDRNDCLYFMYEYQNLPMGIVGLTSIDKKNQNCSWAFYASPEAPKGTGSRMEFITLEKVFNELKLYKIYCEVLAFNSSVIKLHQKFGFQVEGIFKEHFYHEGKYIDVHRLGLFQSEWDLKKQQLKDKILMLNKISK